MCLALYDHELNDGTVDVSLYGVVGFKNTLLLRIASQ